MGKLLRCAKFNPENCTVLNQIVDPDPDIAGIGVILGFLATTCFAIAISFSILFLDHYPRICNFWRHNVSKNPEEYVDNRGLGPYWRSPEFWSIVLSKNLLSFSDTQLVTGLAIQFTGFIKHCQISIYHFQIVVQLAFLTTVTHLLAVITLRDYFVDNKWVNLPRVFFMLCNLALLGYTSFVAYSYELSGLDRSSNLACFFKGHHPPFPAAFGGKWAALFVGGIAVQASIIFTMYFLPSSSKARKGQVKKGRWFYMWLGSLFRTWFIAPLYAGYGLVMAGLELKKTDALGIAAVRINGEDERQWGFGQFLPLLLLALPIFAGWESFWEEKEPERNRYGKTSSRAGSQSALIILDNVDQNLRPDNGVIERTIESFKSGPRDNLMRRSTSRPSVGIQTGGLSTVVGVDEVGYGLDGEGKAKEETEPEPEPESESKGP
ncbi:hypothetical protein P154DRAFT_622348 [Amniculicola lignicola CBS 123094]|uniref:Uncharacterized protein n=1 Tax=Amniculicola lignicola CBS 123094 TaxID=1392246 RepID=A0A6A5WJ00_9PLEO|nr:hypothetical protein P154DRAFT_622348 [Amniculicola lignicola CBS 123094]